MRRLALLLMMMTVALVAAGGVAYPHDHRPPKTVLMKGEEELQRGRLGSYCWVSPLGDGSFSSECRETEVAFPDAEPVRAGRSLGIRIGKATPPGRFSIRTYARVDRNGATVGDGHRVRTTLEPVVVDGETVAWEAVFRVERPGRHYYLEAFGVWRDEQGSGARQDATWVFHVQTRGS